MYHLFISYPFVSFFYDIFVLYLFVPYAFVPYAFVPYAFVPYAFVLYAFVPYLCTSTLHQVFNSFYKNTKVSYLSSRIRFIPIHPWFYEFAKVETFSAPTHTGNDMKSILNSTQDVDAPEAHAILYMLSFNHFQERI